jgi:cyclohexanecarboxyl-CoA dehydrogenase
VLDFTFSEEQEMFRRQVADFCQKEIAPGVKERLQTREFPIELRKKMASIGLCGLNIPEEYGGMLSDMVTFGIATEEISKVDAAAQFYCFDNWIQSSFVKLACEEVKEEWLSGMASGEKLVLMGATEAEAGSDLGNLKTSVKKDGDYFILNGEKNSVSHISEGDAVVVLAKFDPTSRRTITPFLVPVDTPGVSIATIDDFQPMVGGKRGILSMEDARIPAKYLLGDEEGRGFYATMQGFDGTRASGALETLGQAQASLNETCEYVKQRVTFGKPIAKYEGVSFILAEIATIIELGRWMAYRVLWMADNGIRTTKESAMLHYWVSEKGTWIQEQCLLLHGHYGFSTDLPFESRLRDAYVARMGEAPGQIQKMIIARELLGKEFRPYEL